MTNYSSEYAASRAAEIANRKARQEAARDARERRASRDETRAQIERAHGHRGEPVEPEYKPEAEWTTTERQVFAAYGRKPIKGDDPWRDDD